MRVRHSIQAQVRGDVAVVQVEVFAIPLGREVVVVTGRGIVRSRVLRSERKVAYPAEG
jgi:hypothetical protein